MQPLPQPYDIIRSHENRVNSFASFVKYALLPQPHNTFGPLVPQTPNYGSQQFGPSQQPNNGLLFGSSQQPFIYGLPSTLPPRLPVLEPQPSFGPSELSHQPAPFYGPPPPYFGSSIPPPFPQGVVPVVPRPGPPIFIPQTELQLPIAPATDYLPPQSSSSTAPPNESSTSISNAVASSTEKLPGSPTSIDSRLPSLPSSSVDSLPSANQPTLDTVESVPSIPVSNSSISILPASAEAIATSTPSLIPTGITQDNDQTLQTSTEFASPASTVEQSTAGTEAISTTSGESATSTTAAGEDITNNAV